ncbi:MAG TPA: tRNA preQ1(34) S-adenosylmethionine ribosyltransferase-isomerase QueA [Nitrospiria bacterium]|jgi:S-adenosylmethionine:tRNA ribosyltransferase-isomerase
MKLSDFDYSLKESTIAQTPLPHRDRSRLLVFRRETGEITHGIFLDIVEFLQPNDLLILNDTKVNQARLFGRKSSNGKEIECLLLEETEPGCWAALTRGKISVGEEIDFGLGFVGFVIGKSGEGKREIRFLGNKDVPDLIRKKGAMPLPPYIRRPPSPEDKDCYQTVYARHEGSVAAPTAGLHFSRPLLDEIRLKGVRIAHVTLHIGPGTFQPVRTDLIEEHQMEGESYFVGQEVVQEIIKTRETGGRIVGVGTSSARVIESLPDPVPQHHLMGKTHLFIFPGYRFRWLGGFVTNFHLPKSTPYLLTSALVGLPLLKKMYQEAMEKGYRFYSYGDAMMVL